MERTLPPRSTKLSTFILGLGPRVLRLPRLPPTKVSSTSTNLPRHQADRAGRFAHSFANAVRHEPSRFVRDAQHAMQLVALMPFLERQQVGRQEPLVQRDLGALEHGSDRDRELLTAGIALVQASAMLLAPSFVICSPRRNAGR